MAVTKVSLSLDSGLLAQARRLSGRRGLSALVNDALRIKLQHERLRALLDEMDSEYAPVPARLLARARRAWPDPPRSAGRSPRG